MRCIILSLAAILGVPGCTGADQKTMPTAAWQSAAETSTLPWRGVLRSLTSPNPLAAQEGAIAPTAERTLLYVSDYHQSYLYMFSFPDGQQLGSEILKDVVSPQGECVDRYGAIWVVDTGSASIAAYAHGARKPKKVLSDPGSELIGCSIDPKTGDLAVTNMQNTSGDGAVLIYAQASGVPVQYQIQSIQRAFFCTYDDSGNLFVDGIAQKGFALAELRTGQSQFVQLKVDQPIYFPGGVEWDGRYLAVGDQDEGTVYQFSVADRRASLKGTIRLEHATDVVQFWLVRKKRQARAVELVAPDAYNHNVKIYRYPQGGKPFGRFSGRYMWEPIGSAVSPDHAF